MIYDKIRNNMIGQYKNAWDSFGMLVLQVEVVQIHELVRLLKDDYGFDLFLDVTAVDYPERQPRFDLVYHFYNSRHKKRIRLKASVKEGESSVPTLSHWYGSACYLEREVHEMYGIHFAGNDDLRPILLYEGFEGHPLRKDYPIDQEQPLVEYRK